MLFARWLVIALARPRSSHRILLGTLAAYWAVWTAYAVIAKSSQGIHADMGEVVAWSWDLRWGTHKHPPFLPALARLWFSIFPLTGWAYYLLAVGLVVVAIYFSWLLSGFWLRGVKRAAVPFLLMLVPFYNFIALRLDHNVVLIPLWAITTYAFVRAFRSGSIGWSVVTGAAAGAAVLAKYWSFFLLLGLIAAALSDKRRWQFLKSPAPWIMTAISFGLVLPHLIWLDANQYPTFVYAQHSMAETWTDFRHALINYTFGALAYVAVPLIVLTALVRPTPAALRDMLLPSDAERRFAAMIYWVPLIAALPFAFATSTNLNGLWTMSELSLFGVVLLSSPLVRLNVTAASVIALLAMALGAGAVLASPFIAYAKFRGGVENDALYTRQLAVQITKEWRDVTPQPLRYLAGIGVIVNAVTFYMEGQPLPISLFSRTQPWWNTPEQLDRHGVVILCPVADASCTAAAQQRIAAGLTVAKHVTFTIEPHWLWLTGAPRTYAVDIVLPHKPQ
jgi:4-amino-4-deoxy-L-arabinose transferase-like glycosyltransferase